MQGNFANDSPASPAMRNTIALALGCALLFGACGGGAHSSPLSAPTSGANQQTKGCAPAATPSPAPPGPSPVPAAGLSVPPGFNITAIANISGARELAFSPNGDLFVGTGSGGVYVVRNAEGAAPLTQFFANVGDSPASGIALSLKSCALYVGTQHAVYRIAYSIGDARARSASQKIAALRTGNPPPGSDGDVHRTTSVAVDGSTLYASIGSSCNACTEIDPTRATVQKMTLDGSGMSLKAKRIRNGIALAVNPQTGTVWVGGAGQDTLPVGHPYEFFDPLGLHAGVADYGWPECEENRIAYTQGANCSNTIVPAVEFPAYETIVGAAFYPEKQTGSYAFASAYRGGAFVTMHGSWHRPDGCLVKPRIAYVPMSGDMPATPVNWSDPTVQWHDFVTGFQPACSARIGRPTGVAVGPEGDLFFADDFAGKIYRVRPAR